MSSITSARTSDLWRGLSAARTLNRTNAGLARVQREMTDGRRITTPGDAPAEAAVSQQLRKTLEARAGHETNLRQVQRLLGDADQTLADTVDLIREARVVALANIDSTTSPAEREGAAVSLASIQNQLLVLSNKRFAGQPLFGGDRTADPFVTVPGGVKFAGGFGTLDNVVADGISMHLLVNAAHTFGRTSPPAGSAVVAPAATPATHLGDLGGARGQGVARGQIVLNNAGASSVVDLSDADTLADVTDRINAAGVGVTASVVGDSIQLAGLAVSVGEAGSTTAADLGLLVPPGATLVGQGVQPRITTLTPLADLRGGAGVDPAGVLRIDNGPNAADVPLAGLTTVGDLLDRLNGSAAHVSARIADDGRSIELTNPVQGTQMRVADLSGSAAADLGWITFTPDATLAELNGGRGVRLDPNGPDLRIVAAGGAGLDIDLTGVATVDGVVNQINAAATVAGLPVTAAFDPGGPGVILTGIERTMSLGESQAATDLGLDTPVVAGVMAGRDVNPRESRGVFGHLADLIAALRSGDLAKAASAAGHLETDEQDILRARGEAGTRLKEVFARLDRMEDHNLITKDMISQIEDADFADAVTRWQLLQTQLRASMQTSGDLLGRSLFDFLR